MVQLEDGAGRALGARRGGADRDGIERGDGASGLAGGGGGGLSTILDPREEVDGEVTAGPHVVGHIEDQDEAPVGTDRGRLLLEQQSGTVGRRSGRGARNIGAATRRERRRDEEGGDRGEGDEGPCGPSCGGPHLVPAAEALPGARSRAKTVRPDGSTVKPQRS